MQPALWYKSCRWQNDSSALKAIRQKVFIEEQGFRPEEEWDHQGDPVCTHFLVSLTEENEVQPEDAVATARLSDDGCISRVAVLAHYRRQGIGYGLMLKVIQQARKQGLESVYLGAQVQVMPFYSKLGFEAYDKPYMEGPVTHRKMRLKL